MEDKDKDKAKLEIYQRAVNRIDDYFEYACLANNPVTIRIKVMGILAQLNKEFQELRELQKSKTD